LGKVSNKKRTDLSNELRQVRIFFIR